MAFLLALLAGRGRLQERVLHDRVGVAAHRSVVEAAVARRREPRRPLRRRRGRQGDRRGLAAHPVRVGRVGHAAAVGDGAAGERDTADAVLVARLARPLRLALVHVGQQRLIERRGQDHRVLGRLADERMALQLLRVRLVRGPHHDREERRVQPRRQPPLVRRRQRLEERLLVDVLRVRDERQEGRAALLLADDELHRRPDGDVVERRHLRLARRLPNAQPDAANLQTAVARVLRDENDSD